MITTTDTTTQLVQEKDDVMQRFNRHEIDILVSTTVVEVGVNVPNATFMIIYDADRFGLSTRVDKPKRSAS